MNLSLMRPLDMVIISSFNPIRREIAKIALEKLLRDGRIQPARVEELKKPNRR